MQAAEQGEQGPVVLQAAGGKAAKWQMQHIREWHSTLSGNSSQVEAGDADISACCCSGHAQTPARTDIGWWIALLYVSPRISG